jgi:hypothetical protein
VPEFKDEPVTHETDCKAYGAEYRFPGASVRYLRIAYLALARLVFLTLSSLQPLLSTIKHNKPDKSFYKNLATSTMGLCGSKQDYEPGYAGPPPPSGNPKHDQWAQQQYQRDENRRNQQKAAKKKRSKMNGIAAATAGAA